MKIPLFLMMIGLVGCAASSSIPTARFYEYWHAPTSSGPMGIPATYYTELFSERGPKRRFFNATEADFYFAARHDVIALRRFLHSRARRVEGGPGEGWDADMVILALIYGDADLYSALQMEPPEIRQAVGGIIEQLLTEKDRRTFTQTRTLYKW